VTTPEDDPAGCSVVSVVVRSRRAESGFVVLHGRHRPGESVHVAALRVLARATGWGDGDVWVVDLSSRPAVFAADVPDSVTVAPLDAGDADDGLVARVRTIPQVRLGFRPMTRADFADVVTWQTQPYVARWWQDEATDLDAAEKHYGPALDGHDPTRLWVLEVNGRSVGMLQDYLVGDHPDFALLTAKPEDVGFDYLVGDPTWVGSGIGTRMLWTYLRDVVRPHYPAAREYFAAPDHRNAASLRVLDKLGFTRGLWFDEPQRGGGVETMVGCSLDVARVLG
jgi:aminoglycoside 6'-N-acetyltransferase